MPSFLVTRCTHGMIMMCTRLQPIEPEQNPRNINGFTGIVLQPFCNVLQKYETTQIAKMLPKSGCSPLTHKENGLLFIGARSNKTLRKTFPSAPIIFTGCDYSAGYWKQVVSTIEIVLYVLFLKHPRSTICFSFQLAGFHKFAYRPFAAAQ